MHFLAEYAMFFAKVITFVIAIIIVLIAIVALAGKNKITNKTKLKVNNLNKKYQQLEKTLTDELLSKDELKKHHKAEKKTKKADKKKPNNKPNLFVLTFKGDIKAQAVESLRQEITALLMVAKPTDEVMVCIESPGGMVHTYGLAASQLQRIKQANIPLTICVDKVAASGGYLMACVADRLLAAPFAIIGSIGVIAQLPNFNRILKNHDIDIELHTAGQYKRTLTMLGENTKKGREKFQEQLDDTHTLFKEFVSSHRSNMDIEKVATGEYWYGQQALSLQLIDDIQTSDDYLLAAVKAKNIIQLSTQQKKPLATKLTQATANIVEQVRLSIAKQHTEDQFL